MGMTYEELSVYGRLRKIFRCGPVSMFQVYLIFPHPVLFMYSTFHLLFIFSIFHLAMVEGIVKTRGNPMHNQISQCK